jgi:hypothetical protein
MDAGVGPVCRKLDNKLYALKLMPNMPKVLLLLSQLQLEKLPDTARNLVLTQMIPELTASHQWMLATGKPCDFRATVKRVEWVISHDLQDAERHLLIELVESLGFVGLAALWRGEASTGKSLITCVSGRLVLKAARNKFGRAALKKIPGWRFDSISKCWSVPAAAVEQFRTIILTFWPNNEGLDEACLQAQQVLHEASLQVLVQAAEPVQKAPVLSKVTIYPNADQVTVSFPYNAALIEALKAQIPSKNRKWDPIHKMWILAAANLNTFILLVRMTWPEIEIAFEA